MAEQLSKEEILKEALKELPLVEQVFMTEDGDWYFHEPKNIETIAYSREDFIGKEKAKKVSKPSDKDAKADADKE